MDLFDQFETLSPDVQKIINDFDVDKDHYQECSKMEFKLLKKGFRFEYGLDGMPYHLRKI
jgi:hypothetical protein